MGEVKRKRVAVIGTGIAGLSAAFLLSSSRHNLEITLMEREAELGMDAHAVEFTADGKVIRVNTPPRAFSRGYYPNLLELYRRAGVAVEQWSWQYNYCELGNSAPFIRTGKSYFLGFRIPSFSSWSHWVKMFTSSVALVVIRDFLVFHYAIKRDLRDEKLTKLTLREYLQYINVSDVFINKGLLPILSMVLTCTYDSCLEYPVDLIMHYYYTNSTYGQYRTKHGTRDAVTQLSKHVERVITSAHVNEVVANDNGVSVSYIDSKTKEKVNLQFDEVVLATQANHALEMVKNLDTEMHGILSAFKHEKSEVIIHVDEVVMPQKRADWSPMNAMLSPTKNDAMFTIWMNDSFKDLPHNLFQTWNPICPIEESKVVKKIIFERPLATKESLNAVASLKQVNGHNGIWYCGAWTCHRIPLQESGVVSALTIFKAMTGDEPPEGFIDGHNHITVIDQRGGAANQYRSSITNILLVVVSVAAIVGVATRRA